jgi:hypothetical protein
MDINETMFENSYEPSESPIKCSIIARLGYYILAMFICSLILNTYLMIKLRKNRKKPMNKLVLAITFVNLIATIFHVPFVIGSYFSCK